MKFKSSRYVFFLVSICLIPLIGCAGNNQPKISPDKAIAEQIKAEKDKIRLEYLNKLKVAGCDSNDKVKPVGSLKDYKNKIFDRYGRLLNKSGPYKSEMKIFNQCTSIEAIDRFLEVFWSVRDPDISTPVNENKELIDQRISEIESEILFTDHEAAGIRFANQGGLRGDMAHVYLFRGNPDYKIKMEGRFLADLMAWVYFDENQRPLYVFLFYDKCSGYRLFRNHKTMDTVESFKDTFRELAKVHPLSDEDFERLYEELVNNDSTYIFRFAINRFSHYVDIKLEKVLAPPTPEAMTAKAIQPKILGIPNIPKDAKMIMSKYFTKITGFSQLTKGANGEYALVLTISVSGIDWEDVGERLQSGFDLSVSVTNEKTREVKYFVCNLYLNLPEDKYSEISFRLRPNNISNKESNAKGETLPELFKTLAPGDYEVKIFLLHKVTLKQAVWYEYITIDK